MEKDKTAVVGVRTDLPQEESDTSAYLTRSLNNQINKK